MSLAVSVLILMMLLAVGFLSTRIASHLKIPHSVLLVVFGVAAGILTRGRSGMYVEHFSSHFSDIILFIFLPPLIFEAAYDLDFARFRRDLAPISALAVVALFVSTLLIGYSLHWVFGIELLPSLTFGALISATDPVAVVALFREVGAPRRLITLVEGESLLNDGTAIVLFRIFLVAASAQVVHSHVLLWGLWQFVQVSLGGVVVGIVIAVVMSLLLRLAATQAAAQLGLTVVGAYTSFLVAEHLFGVSGVIATLTVGLFLGRRAKLELNAEALAGMRHLWQFLALSANIIVFFAVGLIVDPAVLLESSRFIPLTLAIVYLARAVSVYGTVPLMNNVSFAKPISFSYQTILVWGGLKGGLALGLVLTLPENFPHKKLFVALATSVVFATLFVNALSTGWVLSALRLDQLTAVEERVHLKTAAQIVKSVFEPLLQAGTSGELPYNLVVEHRNRLEAALQLRPGGVTLTEENLTAAEASADVQFKVNSLLLKESHYYDLKRQEGSLSRAAYLHLLQLVATRLELLSAGGIEALQNFHFKIRVESTVPEKILGRLGWKGSSWMLERLTADLEALLHLKSAIEATQGDGELTRQLRMSWLKSADDELKEYYTAYPHYTAIIQSLFIAKVMRARSETALRELRDVGIISPAVFSKAQRNIEQAYETALADSALLLRPSPAYLLARLPVFKGLPKVAVRKLADSAKTLVFGGGQTVFQEGAAGDSFFLVVAGVLELQQKTGGTTNRLFTGDYVGLESLLFSKPRSGTATAVISTELLEVRQNIFQRVLDDYPTIRDAILLQARKDLPG